MKVLPINCGYYNFKSVDGKIVPTRLAIQDFDMIPSNCDVLEYEGIKYIVGYGEINIDTDKTLTEFLKICTLNMLAKFTDTKEIFKLVLTSPPLLVAYQKEIIPPYLKGEYEIVHNGKKKFIEIEDVKVFPETLTAYVTNNASGRLNDKDVLILDIGGVTTNGCLIRRGGNFTIDDVFTIKNGMYHLDDEICRHINRKYYQNISIDDVNHFRENGLYLRGSKENIWMNEIEFIEDTYRKIINEIKIACDLRKWSVDVLHPIITGGGGKILFNSIKGDYLPHAELSKNPIFDNLIGLAELTKKVYRL